MQRFAKGDRNAQQEITKQAAGAEILRPVSRAGMIWPATPWQKHNVGGDFLRFSEGFCFESSEFADFVILIGEPMHRTDAVFGFFISLHLEVRLSYLIPWS